MFTPGIITKGETLHTYTTPEFEGERDYLFEEENTIEKDHLALFVGSLDKAWSKSAATNYGSFIEFINNVLITRRNYGQRSGVPLIISLTDVFFGIKLRIEENIVNHETDQLSRKASYLATSNINTRNYPIITVDIRDNYIANNIGIINGVEISKLEQYLTIFLKKIMEFEDPSGDDIANFEWALEIAFSDEWFINEFINAFSYRSAPLSFDLDQNAVHDYDDEIISEEQAREKYAVTNIIAENTAAGDLVLDLGAGTGISSKFIARALPNLRVFGLDRHNFSGVNRSFDWQDSNIPTNQGTKIDVHRVLGMPSNLRFVEGGVRKFEKDGAGLPFADNSMKVIVLGNIVRHISTDLSNILLEEVFRVLKDDGVILLEEVADSSSPYTMLLRKSCTDENLQKLVELWKEKQIKESQELNELLDYDKDKFKHYYLSLNMNDKLMFEFLLNKLANARDSKINRLLNIISALKIMEHVDNVSVLEEETEFIDYIRNVSGIENSLQELDVEEYVRLVELIQACMRDDHPYKDLTMGYISTFQKSAKEVYSSILIYEIKRVVESNSPLNLTERELRDLVRNANKFKIEKLIEFLEQRASDDLKDVVNQLRYELKLNNLVTTIKGSIKISRFPHDAIFNKPDEFRINIKALKENDKTEIIFLLAQLENSLEITYKEKSSNLMKIVREEIEL